MKKILLGLVIAVNLFGDTYLGETLVDIGNPPLNHPTYNQWGLKTNSERLGRDGGVSTNKIYNKKYKQPSGVEFSWVKVNKYQSVANGKSLLNKVLKKYNLTEISRNTNRASTKVTYQRKWVGDVQITLKVEYLGWNSPPPLKRFSVTYYHKSLVDYIHRRENMLNEKSRKRQKEYNNKLNKALEL